ncbi:MAG TPA: hypothetical protein VIO94_12965 [Phenylobacterium sp.]
MDQVELARKRLKRFIVLDILAIIVAGGAAVGYFAFDIAPLLFVFVGALAAGFAAQIWLVLQMVGRNKEVG